MKRRNIFFIQLLLVIIFSTNLILAVQISPNLEDQFNKNSEKVQVIIEQGETPFLSKLNIFSVEPQIEKITQRDNYYTAEITKEEFELLKQDSSIKRIKEKIPLTIFMDDVVGIVESNTTNTLKEQSINLTGLTQSVCILDTGINNTHSAFSGRIMAEHCFCLNTDLGLGGCCPDLTSEDTSAIDDHSHGTHVAGIVGANGEIKGIAPDVGLVIVKIMDENGNGHPTDLVSGIQWCVDNKDLYNISVITASLGSPSLNSSNSTYCDNIDTDITNSINYATSNNIPVTIATGNNGTWTESIAWPSCVTNSTPVGSVTKINTLSSYSRGPLLKLLGVGSGILSTWNNGTYGVKSGTSMATPQVAGAIAIIKQYLNLISNSMNSTQIEDTLYNTGYKITEGINNFSRINVYDALLSLDSTSPNVNLVSPEDSIVDSNSTQIFYCNATDWQLKNATINVWDNSGLFYNESKEVTGESNETYFSVNSLSSGEYFWNCIFYDNQSNIGMASSNYSININQLVTSGISPANNTGSNQNLTSFECSSTSENAYALSTISIWVWNSTNIVHNETKASSGITNQSTFSYSLENKGNFTWGCSAYNNNSFFAQSGNYSYFYETIKPNVTLISPPNESSYSSNSQSITFEYLVEEDMEINNCSLIVNDAISETNSSITNLSENQYFTKTFSPGTYTWLVNCSDTASNTNSSQEFIFIVNAVSSGNSGGSSSRIKNTITQEKTYYNQNQIEKGFTKKLRKNEKLTFTLNNENHTMNVTAINPVYAQVLIQSEPQELYLVLNKQVKVSLLEGQYNLLLELLSIGENEANISLIKIYEPTEEKEIIPIVIFENNTTNETIEKITNKGEEILDENNSSLWNIIYYIVILILFIIGTLLIKEIFFKKEVEVKKENSSKKNNQNNSKKK